VVCSGCGLWRVSVATYHQATLRQQQLARKADDELRTTCTGFATRLLLHGIVLLVVLVMATTARAQVAIPEDVAAVADEAEAPAEVPMTVSGWPISGALGQRIYCIEGIESTHGRWMYNPTSWAGEHAQGWLGFLPSTARRWGAIIGNRASEWDAAARMIAAGAGRQFYGVGAGIC
jgi:hypothetical protein